VGCRIKSEVVTGHRRQFDEDVFRPLTRRPSVVLDQCAEWTSPTKGVPQRPNDVLAVRAAELTSAVVDRSCPSSSSLARPRAQLFALGDDPPVQSGA